MSETFSDANYVQLEIFPSRLLKPETAQNLLNEIADLEGIIRLFVHGPRLPQTVPYGPATGLPVNHPGNAVIEVAGQAIELAVYVGSIRMEVVDVEVKEQVRKFAKRFFQYHSNSEKVISFQEDRLSATMPSVDLALIR